MSLIILLVGLLASYSVEGYRLASDTAALSELTDPQISVCDICVDGLEEVKSLMTSGQIEKLINDVSDALCNALPGSLAKKCEEVVDDLITESFQLLRDLLDKFPPKSVCQLVHLCPKSKEMDNFTGEAKRCEICQDIAGSVRTIAIDPALEQMIKTNLEFPCKFFWPFETMCQDRIEAIVVDVFAKLRLLFDSYEDVEVCQVVQLCEAPATSTVVKTSLCDACVDTLEEGKSIITSEEVEKLTADFADFACALIPQPTLAKQCKENIADMVSEYFWLARDLVDKFPPKTICQLIDLCSIENSLVTAPKVQTPTLYEQQATLCDLCEDSIVVARTLLTDVKLEQAIATDMKFACVFTGPLREMCEWQVNEAVKLAFDAVRPYIENLDDHELCVDFDFCHEGNKTTVCDVCKGSYEEVKSVLVGDQLKNLVVTSSKFGCRFFGPFRHMCENIVMDVVDEVFFVIHRELDSVDGEAFCEKFHMCSAKTVLYSEVQSGFQGGFCDICQDMINTVEDQISNEKMKKLFDDFGKLPCAYFGPFKTTCEDIVDQVNSKSFELLREYFKLYSSDKLCKVIQLC